MSENAPKELPAAVPTPVATLTEYQTGSIVSRTLLKRPGGTVTAFAFDVGQGLSEHTTPFDAVAHILDGEAEITIAGNARVVSAGELIVMPAHQPHALTARTPFKMLLVMIRSAS